jgi:prepilin-type N-terminal cleavage/methylation domain-containing protein
MKLLKTKKQRAFSLVELLVVIAIIGILSAILLTSLGSSKTLKEIDGASSLAATLLRETQTAALTGQQDVADTVPCLYRLNYGGSVITRYYFWKDAAGNCSNSTLLQTATLPAAVTVTNSGTVDFVPPHARINQNFTLVFSHSGYQGVACLYSNGRIETLSNTGTCP